MSTNSSGLKQHKDLAESILKELNIIAAEFSKFQNENAGFVCPSGCGKCCFKKDVYCSPVELLPMALDLLAKGTALDVYEKCLNYSGDVCALLNVTDKEKFSGYCTEYAYRPLICRAFGVAGMHTKNNEIKFAVCSIFKEKEKELYGKFSEEQIPFIDSSKARLTGLDPRFLEEEHPIYISLRIMLEKVLLLSQLHP